MLDLGGMGIGWRELGFPGERVSVALIITGSEKYGYVNSLQLNNIAWMRSMYDIIKDRQVRYVVVPGAHDAAMSKLSLDSGWWGGGSASNTETQSLDHYNQLRVGVRYFDMRIVSINGGDFWSAHVTDETGKIPAGATGDVTIPPPTLQLIANQETNPALYHYGLNKITPDYFPTVILHDAVGLFQVSDLSEANYNPMMQTLVIGLNLYMVTQNCKVSNVKNPLLKSKAQAKTFSASPNAGGFKTFRGVIFANGTVLNEAPPGFCRTCTYNDTAAIDHLVANTTGSVAVW
ncbi:hypothetical protein VTI74DRAFT_4556 [Chaetomium olivicolor]